MPSVVPQLDNVRLKNPIEQHMLGQGGLFQQQNIEKRRLLSVREWFELCAKDEFRVPGVDEVGLHARANNGTAWTRRRTRRATTNPRASVDVRMSETAEPESHPLIDVKHEHDDELVPPELVDPASALVSPPNSNQHLSPAEDAPQQSSATPGHPAGEEVDQGEEEGVQAVIEADEDVKGESAEMEDMKQKRGRRPGPTRETKEARLSTRRETVSGWRPSIHIRHGCPRRRPHRATTSSFAKSLRGDVGGTAGLASHHDTGRTCKARLPCGLLDGASYAPETGSVGISDTAPVIGPFSATVSNVARSEMTE